MLMLQILDIFDMLHLHWFFCIVLLSTLAPTCIIVFVALWRSVPWWCGQRESKLVKDSIIAPPPCSNLIHRHIWLRYQYQKTEIKRSCKSSSHVVCGKKDTLWVMYLKSISLTITPPLDPTLKKSIYIFSFIFF